MSKNNRATLDEVLEFANAVRKAGGGNPIDALMPAVPEDAEQCLIAKNLNFNCNVNADGPNDAWCMHVSGEILARRIGDQLGLEVVNTQSNLDPYSVPDWAVVLPEEIGHVASDFDHWYDSYTVNRHGHYVVFEDEEEYFKEFLPYVEAAYDEVARIGVFNSKGELIL